VSLIDLLKKLKPANELADFSLTPRAQQALLLARQEATRLHQNFFGTEHVLLGLVKLGQGVPVTVLENMGMNLENIRAEVEKNAVAEEEQMFGNLPYTPRTRRVLQTAKDEAKALHHTYIGTEHILLALLREHEGPAAEIFKKFRADAEEVRKGILKELNP
jgi:ATP-dependent Clp protease ATP-binding subunit ClpC